MDSMDELLAKEVHKRPFLYDKSNELYSSRIASDNGWTAITEILSQQCHTSMDCEELKKHWKSLRDKYKRAKGKYDFFVEQSGGKDTSLASYFMKEHLFFLDPHLQDRRKISDNGRQEENDPLLEVALNIIDGTNCTSESPLKKKKKKNDKTETDEDLLFMRSLIPSMKRITNSYTKSVVKMTIMKIIHEAVYLNKVEVHHIGSSSSN